ncbi:MAG TPA: nucleotidyltransferase domain-containing protein [Egibacteraceae bacterium]|nr:nucleotidyltransferase domain-containing protein [Egibacteraceae bacterium]
MLDRAVVDAAHGTAWCRAWTARVDAALRDLLTDSAGVAVVATGGYARRELCPASDIDLLLLHNGWGRRDLEGLVQQLCYPLWDAGLTVGYAVRTPAEATADAGRDITTATALVDRRLVAGDVGLVDGLSTRVARWSRRNGRRLVGDLLIADRQRHDRAAGRTDIKNAHGGLRDLHSLRWAGAWLLGDATLDALVAAGYVAAPARRDLAAANETLLRVRCRLHAAHPTKRGAVDVPTPADADEVRPAMAAVSAAYEAARYRFTLDVQRGRRRRK